MERGEWEGIDSCIIRNFMDQNQHECLICNLPLFISLTEPNMAQAKKNICKTFQNKIGNVTG